MARLPTVDRRGALTQAPISRVSGETVATPYRVASDLLGQAGEIVQRAALAKAGPAGQAAVERDENGNLTVNFLSDISEWGRQYNQAAAQSYLARLSSDMRDQAQQLAIEANGDIDRFQDAWTGYTTGILDIAPERTQGSVLNMLEEIGSQQSRSIVSTRYTNDINEAKQALLAERDRLEIELLNLAFNGGAESEDFANLYAQWRDIGQELAGNPVYGVSAEAQSLTDRRFDGQALIETVRGQVRELFPTNPRAAREFAEEAFADPEILLTPEEKRAAVAAIMREYDAVSSEYRLAVAQLTEDAAAFIARLDNDQPWNATEAQELFNRAEFLNAGGVLADLRAGLSGNLTVARVRDMAPEEKIQFYTETVLGMTGGLYAEPTEFLAARSTGGVNWTDMDPDFAGQLAVAILDGEAALRAQGINVEAQIVSARRTNAEQQRLYERYMNGEISLAARPGTSRHERGAAADIAAGPLLDWLHQNASEYGLAFLTGNAFTLDPGHIQLAGPMPVNTQPMPSSTLTRVESVMRDELTGDGGLIDQARTIVDELGRGLDYRTAEVLVDYANALNDPTISRQVADILIDDAGQEMAVGLSPLEFEALSTQLVFDDQYLEARIRNTWRDLETRQNQIRASNPLEWGDFQGWYDYTPIDTSSDDAITAGIAQRESQATIYRERTDSDAVGLFSPAEAASFAARFQTAAPDERLALATLLANTIKDRATLNATMAQVAGAGSGVATYAFAGALAADNPIAAEGIIRGAAILEAEPEWRPSADDLNAELHTALPPAMFPADALDIRPQLVDAIMLRYVDLLHPNGDPQAAINTELLNQAIAEITGGVLDFKGGKIVAPVYGFSQEELTGGAFGFGQEGLANNMPRLVMNGAALATGEPVTWSDVWDSRFGGPEYRLISFADGRYLIAEITGPEPVFVLNRFTQEAFVLDLGAAVSITRGENELYNYLAGMGMQPPERRSTVLPADQRERAERLDERIRDFEEAIQQGAEAGTPLPAALDTPPAAPPPRLAPPQQRPGFAPQGEREPDDAYRTRMMDWMQGLGTEHLLQFPTEWELNPIQSEVLNEVLFQRQQPAPAPDAEPAGPEAPVNVNTPDAMKPIGDPGSGVVVETFPVWESLTETFVNEAARFVGMPLDEFKAALAGEYGVTVEQLEAQIQGRRSVGGDKARNNNKQGFFPVKTEDVQRLAGERDRVLETPYQEMALQDFDRLAQIFLDMGAWSRNEITPELVARQIAVRQNVRYADVLDHFQSLLGGGPFPRRRPPNAS